MYFSAKPAGEKELSKEKEVESLDEAASEGEDEQTEVNDVSDEQQEDEKENEDDESDEEQGEFMQLI